MSAYLDKKTLNFPQKCMSVGACAVLSQHGLIFLIESFLDE
jgi:hypothetical protein